jgi:two-component system nitrogen regulation response regulator NtrX
LVQRLLVLGGEAQIDASEVESALGRRPAAAPAASVASGDEGGFRADFSQPLREARDQFERAYLLHWLEQCEGSVGKLAKAVGMERTHLYRKLRDLGIELRPGKDG